MNEALLKRLAWKYIWWKTPDEAILYPHRVMAQVMNIGDFQDVLELADAVGEEVPRDVVKTAEAGEFNSRSWHYWHYRLGLAELGAVPPLPQRRVG